LSTSRAYHPGVLTLALWAFVILFASISLALWYRKRPEPRLASSSRQAGYRTPADPVPLEDQILDVARSLGPEAAAQRFSVPLKTVRRLRVLHNLELKSCGTCEYFDLTKGQTAIASDANMAKITKALSPAKISRDDTNNQSWLDFGACLKQPGTITGSTDWCGSPKHKTEDMWA
jgi:hypothetical protein